MRSRIAGRKPANWGWSSAKPQRDDMGAVKTRARCRSASARTTSHAPSRSTPAPITNAGRSLASSAAPIAARASASQRGAAPIRRGSTGAQRARPVVGRDRDQHRAARVLHRDVVTMRDRERDVLGACRLAAPLDIGLRQLGGPSGKQERIEGEQRSRLLAGGDDERRPVLPGGEDRAHGVAHPDRRMQVDEGGVLRRRGVAVGHADHDRFLQAEDVLEVRGEVEEERQLGGPGLPKMRCMPNARSSWRTASRTVVRPPASSRAIAVTADAVRAGTRTETSRRGNERRG